MAIMMKCAKYLLAHKPVINSAVTSGLMGTQTLGVCLIDAGVFFLAVSRAFSETCT